MNHTHIVRPNTEEQRLKIFRKLEGGKEVLYTHVDLRTNDDVERPLSEVAVQLGECLLMDSDMGRNLS